MNSGVYELKFPNDYIYIGKADDIDRRWAQHKKDFEAGKHTKKLQWAYDTFGPPTYEVSYRIHADHIDLVESLLIEQFAGPKSLNGNQPRKVSQHERAILATFGEDYLSESTASHIKMLVNSSRELDAKDQEIGELQDRVTELCNEGIVLPHEVAEKLTELEYRLIKKNQELSRLANLGWFDRLFNYKVTC